MLRASLLCRQRNTSRIVIPRIPSAAAAGGRGGHRHSTNTTYDDNESVTKTGQPSEYHSNKRIPSQTGTFLGRGGAAALARQQQLSGFNAAGEAAVERVWRDSKPHLRKQQRLVDEMGVEGAVRETLQPTKTSFRQELKARPLDRAILEEIYLGLHGKRIERQLKKGVSWEHWITKGDGTAPVYTTSAKGQQTFAFGGQIRQVAAATHPQQFPVITVPGKDAAIAAKRGVAAGVDLSISNSSKSSNRRRGKRGGGAPALVDRELLLPEVAFIGRTSSGKSSLVNTLVNAMVAPYGHLQGTTNELRFYSIANRVMLVDCPGYGYYNPMETPQLDAENAVKAMRAYLRAGGARAGGGRKKKKDPTAATVGATGAGADSGNAHDDEDEDEPMDGGNGDDDDNSTSRHPTQPRNLKRVFLCVPAKGLQHTDLAYCRLLERLGVPFAVVLTKTDGAPIRMLARLTDHTRSQLVQFSQCKELMLTSSLRLAGIDKVQSLIGSVAVTGNKMDGATMDFNSIV